MKALLTDDAVYHPAGTYGGAPANIDGPAGIIAFLMQGDLPVSEVPASVITPGSRSVLLEAVIQRSSPVVEGFETEALSAFVFHFERSRISQVYAYSTAQALGSACQDRCIERWLATRSADSASLGHEAVTVARDQIEAFNERDRARWEAAFAPTVHFHNPPYFTPKAAADDGFKYDGRWDAGHLDGQGTRAFAQVSFHYRLSEAAGWTRGDVLQTYQVADGLIGASLGYISYSDAASADAIREAVGSTSTSTGCGYSARPLRKAKATASARLATPIFT